MSIRIEKGLALFVGFFIEIPTNSIYMILQLIGIVNNLFERNFHFDQIL